MRRRQANQDTRLRDGARRTARPAFTLVEALLATTVLAIVAATAALPFAAGVQNANAAIELEQAVELGEALMEEVLARPFFAPGEETPAPGPDAGEPVRTNFDNIDDFHGYTEPASELRDFDDKLMAGESLEGFSRSVTVQYVTFPDQAADDINSFVHVQVRVFRDGALLVTLDRIVSRED